MTTKVDTDKIGMIIGPSGKTIRAIQEETDSQVSIEDDGTILIHAKDQTSGEQAKAMIDSIVREPEIGEVYLILKFGFKQCYSLNLAKASPSMWNFGKRLPMR